MPNTQVVFVFIFLKASVMHFQIQILFSCSGSSRDNLMEGSSKRENDRIRPYEEAWVTMSNPKTAWYGEHLIA